MKLGIRALLLGVTSAAMVMTSGSGHAVPACGFGALSLGQERRVNQLVENRLQDVMNPVPAGLALKGSQIDVPGMVELALSLSGPEKAKLLEKVTSMPATRETALKKEILNLALGDDKAWESLVSNASAGAFDDLTLSYLTPILRGASVQHRDAAIEKIGLAYEAAIRSKNGPAVSGRVDKGSLDILSRHLTRADAEFGHAVLEREPAFEALGRYFDRVRSSFPPGSSLRSYDASTVQSAALKVQEALKAKNSRATVTLAGSFTNGRALPGVSDVDVFVKETLREEVASDVRNGISSGIREAGVARLRVKTNVVTAEQLAAFSRRSPVIVRITADRIEVLIYSLPEQVTSSEGLRTAIPLIPVGLSLK